MAGGGQLSIEHRWYASLAAGEPDWSIYADDEYLAEAWVCWVGYSRPYLRQIVSLGLMPSTVVDLGCGVGLTTAALTQMYPGAAVTGTNLGETPQARVAAQLATEHGFAVDVQGLPPGPTDLVFASEYFEHFENPVAHLVDVLTCTQPRVLVVANAFGGRAAGHFHRYHVSGRAVPGHVASRLFGKTLTRWGMRKRVTGFWNNRPAVWEMTR